MITRTNTSLEEYGIVHPLFDKAEVKLSAAGLGRIKMSPSVKVSLFALRAYLIFMFVLLAYHMIHLANSAPSPLKGSGLG